MNTLATSPNRIKALFARKNEPLLNVYYTAGYPNLDDTLPVLQGLQEAGVDLVEIGIPYSDPVADGETIQQSNQRALQNGITLELLLNQLADCRSTIHMPILLMGYLNPILQFGVESFCRRCWEIGIDGLILPDLPLPIYQSEFKAIFCRYGLRPVFLITPQTPESRIRLIDDLTDSFLYMVSSASITGAQRTYDPAMQHYFGRIDAMNLRNPRLIGFGIYNRELFELAGRHAQGAVVGSAFIRHLQTGPVTAQHIRQFVTTIRPQVVYNEAIF